MKIAYLDTSAALKLVIEEPESEALADQLVASNDVRLVGSWLLHTELHCAAGRHPDQVGLGEIQGVLNVVNLVDLNRGDMISAGTHAPLRLNDAIHLAVAIRLGADEMITYDTELAAASLSAGLRIVDPA